MENTAYFCEPCNVEVNLNNKESHENGRKHINKVRYGAKTSTAQDKKQNSTDSSTKKLLIRGYPGYTTPDDLRKCLARCCKNYKIEQFASSHAVVQFSTEEDSEKAISAQSDMFVYGKNIQIRYFEPHLVQSAVNNKANQNKQQPKRQFVMSKSKEIIIEPKEIDLSGDFDTQCQAILNAVRLTREEAESISLLYSNLSDLFQCLWPGCVAVPFGSITTGLGIKTSDADCFIEIPHQYRQGGIYSYVPKARKLMQRYPQIFAEVLAIPRANTPIVKFFHIPTEINCDVSFKTPLGVRNSQLITFLLRTDNRILYLCILLKYWARIHSLTGTGKLSNYALTMMIIFYLQQEPNRMLHCVQFLQRGQNLFIDYWNTGFINHHHLLPILTSKASLCDLMGGFFQYYKKFNFKNDIVCPYLGIPIQKAHFKDRDNVSDAFEIYKNNARMGYSLSLNTKPEIVIQDPFEHSRNISSCVGFKLFNEIVQTVQWAADIYEEEKKKDDNCNNFLRKILLEKPKIKPAESDKWCKVMLNPYLLKNLPEEKWIDLVLDAFLSIFKDIFRFSVTKEDPKEDSPAISKKQKESYLCKASQLVWDRKKFQDPNPDFLKQQIAITKKIIKNDSTETISMHVIVDIVFLKPERKCSLALKLENEDENRFLQFGQFCAVHLSQWFQKLLMKHVKSDQNKLKSDNNNDKPEMESSNKKSNDTEAPGTTANVDQMDVDSLGKVERSVSTHSKTKCQDIPKGKSEFTDSQNSSPDSNPPTKIQKTD